MREAPSIPFNALHALVLVARHGALGPAAEALGVTPGAVSQHIRRAEDRSGLALFERTPKGLVPTRALLEVLTDLDTGFTALTRAQAGLMAPSRDRNLLTVTVGNVFASRWLIWRLADLGATHPEIELKLLTTGALVDLGRPDVDCGIRFGAGDWPGVAAEPIGTHAVFPVCAPALAERLRTPADLAHVPVIMDQASMLSWPDWLATVGQPDLKLSGPTISDPALAFDAAIAGQGVLLALGIMADYGLERRQVVAPFPTITHSKFGYWFATAKGRGLPARTRKFRSWLLSQMNACETATQKVVARRSL
ncbi:LysR substrate-binding domain-containing protein [Pelagibacterium sp.]|uniref:LysR substrate-binding domain-containing protein n=1 Tax=Pelagibacterium sp. TaxID=1967288 RepID=UPI003BA91F3F